MPGWAVLRAEGLALVRVGRWLWLAHSAALLAAQLDLLLVNHWRDAAETGMYALALNLAAKADIVNGGLYTVLLPAAAALAGPGAVRHYLRRGFVRSGLIALALLPTGLLIGWFIDTFYGTDYHPAARLYQLLLVVVIFDLLTTPLVLLAYHHQRPQLLAGADLLRVVVLLAVGAVLIGGGAARRGDGGGGGPVGGEGGGCPPGAAAAAAWGGRLNPRHPQGYPVGDFKRVVIDHPMGGG
ncbi:MAG: hypothetical protein U0841_15730 [Chloroflexia bacterium]